MGWIGSAKQVDWVLHVMGADRDEAGKYLVAGGIFNFMGLGEELLVADDAVYFVGGKQASLAGALNSTSYGIRGVHVIA